MSLMVLLQTSRFDVQLVRIALLSACVASSCGGAEPEFHESADVFRIVMLPDTQCYARYAPEVMEAQATWIADNASRLGVVHVVHVGDITDTNAPAADARYYRLLRQF